MTKSSKPKVLLIPDRLDWILGRIAREIVKWNSGIDFTVVSEVWLRKYPDEVQSLLNAFDIIHCVSPYVYPKYKAFFSGLSVTSIHHVIDWQIVKDNTLADAVFVSCAEWKSYLLDKGVSQSKIFQIPYGVDTELFIPVGRKEKDRVRKKYGVANDGFVIGFFGKHSSNMNDRKGVDVMVVTLKRLRERISGKLTVVVTGSGWEQLADTLATIDISCCYPGFLPRYQSLKEMYGMLDVYLITSRMEGGPVTLLEAMSCGIPVVTTPVGMARGIVENEYNGLTIPKDDPEATVVQILKIIKSPALALTISQNARKSMVEEYQWQSTISTVQDVYQQLLSKKAFSSRSRSLNGKAKKQLESIVVQDQLLHLDRVNQGGYRFYALLVHIRFLIQHPLRLEVWTHFLKKLVKRSVG